MKIKLFVSFVFLLAIVISSIIVWEVVSHHFGDDAIHIAFVGPLSGEDEVKGKSMKQALEMYVDHANEQRDANQQKIVLDFHDDENKPETAYKMAQEIVESKAVAVIGHRRSDCSIRGGEIYKDHILAITPTSTQTEITRKNKWYFRTFYDNEMQARFLAKYAKRFLLQQHNTVSIIYLDTIYGEELADIFEKTSIALNVKVKHKWKLTNDASKREGDVKRIVTDLKEKSANAGLIFLATQSNGGEKLIKQIREAKIENQLIAPDSYANIQDNFKDYPKEKKTPGYYTDGIYVASFIVDLFSQAANDFNARYQEKYEKDLPGAAFYTVDAAILIIEIIQQIKPKGQQELLSSYRKRLRDSLAQVNKKEEPIEGLTGPNFFDEYGDISKPISIGVYRNSHLISAPLQLSYDDDTKYRTVVYTGVQFNEIEISQHGKNIGKENIPDFYLWFRFMEEDGGVIKPQDVEFINAVSHFKLGVPYIKETIEGQTYLRYRIKGKSFKEYIPLRSKTGIHTEHAFFNTQHIFGVNFRHNHLDKDELIYVSDILGTSFKTTEQSEWQKLKNQKLISLNHWKIDKIHFFQNITERETFGHPKYFEKKATFSTFNANVWIKHSDLFYHEIISHQFASEFLIFTAIITLLLFMVSYAERFLRYLWFVQAIFAFLLLISLEIFLDHVREETYVEYTYTDIETLRAFVTITFDILWWLIPAILLDVAVRRFLWMPLEEKTGRPVPGLMRFLISFIIYSLACFGIIAFVFERPITSLLATGGLLTAVFGLAIRTNLSNIFSGIALSIERSFRVGDWVKIGSDEGQVVDMNWRVTNIQTRGKHILSIPNSKVSSSNIHNFSYPDNQYWLKCTVYIDPKYDPRKIEEILIRAVLFVKKDVMTDVKPVILFNGIITNAKSVILLDNIKESNVNSLVVSYAVFFKTENYKYKGRVLKNVWQSIWIHLSQAGVLIPAKQHHQDEIRRTTASTPTQLEEDVLTKGHLQNMIGI
ncbi:ABC transporter substrate-binding protein [Candidatus Parabeggiatoa sp. HSG14]|uniref:ABC transporter substrate-binding protein n=1 Tax=Candidatus Parabeggiatoa sp. HSG14 TaxID=3055593 RepID=UPI0025A92393|nr:mechanosensitive ion channel [Thiotrichales bacterium HSG14]